MSYLQTKPGELVRGALVDRLADYLASFWPELPLKYIRMNATGPKYSCVKDDDKQFVPLTYNDLLAHATGERTIGAHLHDADGRCRVGALDIDEGGRPAQLAALEAAARLGYTAFDIYQPAGSGPGAEHDGGRLVVPFKSFVSWRDIRAVMEQIREAAGLPEKTEIWPGNNNGLGLPLGYHIRKQTRGELLTQAGDVVNLDEDLGAGVELVTSLPANGKPAAAPQVEPVSPRGEISKILEKPARRITLGEVAAERASLDDVKARFIAEHPLPDLLANWGAAQTSSKDWTCPFCKHAHTNTLFIYEDRVFSRSPNCKIPQKRGLDAFGLYVLIEHNDNVIDALKTLNPIAPRKRRQDPPLAKPQVYRTAAQAADADRKRTERRAAVERRRDTVLSRAAIDDDLPWQSRELLDLHLKLSNQRGWHRASVARMAELLGRGERWVQKANEYLVDVYVSRTLAGRYDTAIWTLLETPIERAATPENDNSGVIELDAENDGRSPESILESNLDRTHELVSGGPVDAPPEPEPDPGLVAYVPGLAWEADEPDRATRDYAVLTTVELEAEAERLEQVLQPADEQPAEPVGEPGEASYDPALDCIEGPTTWSEALWRDPTAMWQKPQSAVCDQLVKNVNFTDLPDPEVLSPPTDPQASARYYALRGRARKATSDKQRFVLNRQADTLMVYVPASEAMARASPAPPRRAAVVVQGVLL